MARVVAYNAFRNVIKDGKGRFEPVARGITRVRYGFMDSNTGHYLSDQV